MKFNEFGIVLYNMFNIYMILLYCNWLSIQKMELIFIKSYIRIIWMWNNYYECEIEIYN